jgi:hypothetical protein
MASFDYEKGFVGGLKVAPVSRDEDRVGRATAVHAQVTESFEFGEFVCEQWELLCGSPAKTTLYEFEGSINAITCYRCIALLDRWSRDSINARCTGHVITRDGVTRAVAAKSVLFAGELLDVNHQMLAKRGQVKIDLARTDVGDGLDPIRVLLTGQDYGAVFERRDDEQQWRIIKPAGDAEQALLKRKLGESSRGNTAKQGEVRQNHLVRLSEAESARLKLLGGAAWVRQKVAATSIPYHLVQLTAEDCARLLRLDEFAWVREKNAKAAAPRKKRKFPDDDAGSPLKGFTLRATDEEWDKLLKLGGNTWVRSVINAEAA